ncbi:M56 family metallopeptidase [Paenibacillus sp. N4]|uniref:M56 family metallopeptidase n=1 Tax=Paenibacillus vietnamensis TaxID=2590547 RepID=UPI001CD17277|nr:M56 family metallopeptidase [Paenibacillus vietnamensis]MCA0754188.1 M56 family metallopeptidase [Paenibacillus vietnamensis]
MRRWERKSALVLLLSFGIAILVWSQMGMYMAHLLFGVDVKVNVFKFCISLFHEHTTYYFLMITLLNALIAYSFLVTLIKLAQQFISSRRLKVRLLAIRDIKLTAAIIESFEPVNQNLIVISHPQAVAFTVGLRNPLIVLSSALIETLSRDELDAVIQHETFHQSHYDTAKIFMLQLAAQSLWFVPLSRWSLKNYKIMSELMADEYAITKTGSELGLGSALVKLIKNAFSDNPTPVLAHFNDGVVNYRLQQLVEPQDGIPVKLNIVSIVISVQVLLLFMGMIVLAVT